MFFRNFVFFLPLFSALSFSFAADTVFVNSAKFDPDTGLVSNGTVPVTGVTRLRSVGTGNDAVWTLDGILSGPYRVDVCFDKAWQGSCKFLVESRDGNAEVSMEAAAAGEWKTLGDFHFINAGQITQFLPDGAKTQFESVAAMRLVPLFTPSSKRAAPINSVPPAVGLCIDDLGSRAPTPGSWPDTLFTGAPKLTYAIIGLQTNAIPVLQSAQARGLETFSHIPMQAISTDPDPSLQPNRLYDTLSDTEILVRLRRHLTESNGYVVGINNHEGSQFTQYAHGMGVVADELKSRDLLFFDSRTTLASAPSVAMKVCLQKGLLSNQLDSFLDDASSNAATRDKIANWAANSLTAPNLSWCGIAHERVNSYQGIVDAMPVLATMGIEVRPITKQSVYIIESDFVPPGASFTTTGNASTDSNDLVTEERLLDGTATRIQSGSPGSARFTPNLPKEGKYRVYVGYSAGDGNNCDVARVTVGTLYGETEFVLNQQLDPNRWHYIGSRSFYSTGNNYVQLDNSLCTNPAHVIRAETVKFQYDGAPEAPVNAAQDWNLFR